jgi:hypothetical protein
MAAGIETPDDLTEEELRQVHADIVAYLLNQAEIEDILVASFAG